jgi:hypothetical protein
MLTSVLIFPNVRNLIGLVSVRNGRTMPRKKRIAGAEKDLAGLLKTATERAATSGS